MADNKFLWVIAAIVLVMAAQSGFRFFGGIYDVQYGNAADYQKLDLTKCILQSPGSPDVYDVAQDSLSLSMATTSLDSSKYASLGCGQAFSRIISCNDASFPDLTTTSVFIDGMQIYVSSASGSPGLSDIGVFDQSGHEASLTSTGMQSGSINQNRLVFLNISYSPSTDTIYVIGKQTNVNNPTVVLNAVSASSLNKNEKWYIGLKGTFSTPSGSCSDLTVQTDMGGYYVARPKVCGDGFITGSEVCDGNSLSCTINGYSGSQVCNAQCSGFGSCTSTLRCGDGQVNGNEVCDGGSQSCTVNGYSGSQSCKSDCTGYVSCVSSQRCGDNLVNGQEVCDGTALSGKSCQTQGYSSGTLSCKSDCSNYDVTACSNPPTQTCGNNIREGSETCDGTDLVGQSCTTKGFASGTLSCNTQCNAYVTTQCTAQAQTQQTSNTTTTTQQQTTGGGGGGSTTATTTTTTTTQEVVAIPVDEGLTTVQKLLIAAVVLFIIYAVTKKNKTTVNVFSRFRRRRR